MTRCTVTAIAPDGRRTSCVVEAKSLYQAVFAYNYKAVSDPSLIRPLPDNHTVFEVQPEGRDITHCTWAQVNAWAKREAQRAPRRIPRSR